MKPLVKLFIYCSIIAVYNYAIVANAEPFNDVLMGEEPPQEPPEDVPQEQPLRPRRSVAEENAVNLEQQDMRQDPPQEPPQAFRQKRQMPPPPPDMPRPPMPSIGN
uniref:Uncharacterized protein n=1 Tax=Stomoxys calcitrans TaxID=35570 RepID=A0A1I8PPQ4_STOCA